MTDPHLTPYEAIGGEATLRPLIEAFYGRVAAHPNLAPLFTGDFSEIKAKQMAFLTQFLGGPALYSEQYGSPMMRARHLPFPIDPQRARDWLACMSGAMDEIGLAGPPREWLFQRLSQVAMNFVNQ